ncbi:uncharacterized protein LOC130549554 isoform X1 [Triplophysa rosa]|uniref:uncharacterized protein LOC130549554 isoform X1 n=1 Tax=Triplophysa rosa TaxID=992332 RepID=UPI002546285A|nr:uncharacterized protein LOC130549554 isoform X1 [Triplophysa rosa]
MLFGDSFKDLVVKKNLLILGKDIWKKDESRGVRVKKKMLDTNNKVEAKKTRLAKQTKIKEAARDQVLQKLKNSLSQSRAVDTQDQSTSSEDEVPQCLHNVKQAKTKKAARPLAFTSDHHISSDEVTNIASPLRHTSSDDATNIGSPEMFQANDLDEDFGLTSTQRKIKDSNTGPKMLFQMDEEILTSLRELPEMIKSMKECVQCVQSLIASPGGIPSSGMSSVSSTLASEIEMHSLAGSGVSVPKRAFQRLNRSRITIFAQELAVLVFTKELLAESTLTGKSGRGGPPKKQLDVEKVQAITDAVLVEFPHTTASDVRAAIRRKCNNEQFSKKN